ncbi:conserved archaeal protein [Hyperthermus butylicus DSM 5456]|uniref:Conserved archaeal protein n=1 Tax=Hyperthermus butylicus (strain DSM 5456 / JCM 9403 / PLM1-5) TaxID=415426 RepID=A2BKB2_HYPBU|nr:conserved archaeal protein [Hyperthermus butylicus DSM 5456]
MSAKIRRELKEEAERLGIDFSEVIRRAIEEEVKRRKLQLLREKLNGLRGALEKIDVEEIVELIRRDREER